MGRPAKPFEVLSSEKKSHRTKAELSARKSGEEALLTGKLLKAHPEVKSNEVAAKEFKRINSLLKIIGKNDAIYELIINRYCLIYAECFDFEKKRESFYSDLQELTENKEKIIEEGTSLTSYYKLKNNMQSAIINLDKQVQAKRKMLFDIEKENIMTISAALRSIPKKQEEKGSALKAALRNA